MAAPCRGLAELSDNDRQELEAWLFEFDQRWVMGLLSEKARRIPPASSWRLAALGEMVKIDLQRQWGRGNRLELETYLKEYPELGNPADVSADLIQAEFEVRKQFGAEPDLDDYVRRFPAQAGELRRLIAAGGSSLLSDDEPQMSLDTTSERERAHTKADRELPEQFGRYRIIRRLGAGGMGSVYLAEDTRLKRKVALKVAHIGGSKIRHVLGRFYREAEAAAGLDHPGLCKVYDVGEIDNVHYLTMEYIEGTTLADLIDGKSNVSQRHAAAIIGNLALALQEAHAKSVVHRDLKPANVMIRQTGRKAPVIVDFGLAQQVNTSGMRLTRTGQVIGTPYYMSVEQVKGERDAIGPGCDIYALGVILYELLTGQVPFDGANPMAVISQILTKQATLPSTLRPDLDPRLEAICLKAMAKEIGDRYTSMAELGAALNDYLLSSAVASSSPSPARPDWPAAGSSRHQDSDTLMDQFFEELASENAAAPIIDSRPRAKAKSIVPPVPGHGDESRRPRWPLIAAAAGLGLILLGFIIYVNADRIHRGTDFGAPKSKSNVAEEEGKKNVDITVQPKEVEPREEWVSPATNLKFVLIPSGSFQMGSPDDDKDALDDEKPRHSVRITRPFYLGVSEVTQGQYRAVTGKNPSSFKGPDELPVEQVSWLDAVAFCNELSRKENLAPFYVIEGADVAVPDWNAAGYRLPTEAEWEYACRAGSSTRYNFGDDAASLVEYAWDHLNSRGKTHPVREKRPNAWGLFDMHGNVWEWCWDSYDGDSYANVPEVNPHGPASTSLRVRRGGSYVLNPCDQRSAFRARYYRDFRTHDVGFRVARGQFDSSDRREKGSRGDSGP
jgi:formylglycine-generating enzyme required for sulfatase activity/predicted Ser/Thr protein kinase